MAQTIDAAPRAEGRAEWLMLLALTSAFALSQAYRTVAAIMAPQLQADFGLSAQALGLFASVFHFAFGVLQLAMGIGIDLYGVRRTVLVAFPLTIVGALLSAFTTNYGLLLFAQALIGVGCAPAFLVCTVFIAQRFPLDRYASVSGIVLAIGGLGMLITGTPLAWLIDASSWRIGFAALGVLSVIAWLVILRAVRERSAPPAARMAHDSAARASFVDALRGFGALFAVPHTWGIIVLGAVTYAAFVSLRGLWLGPLLIERHGFTLVQAGHVAIAVSIGSMLLLPVFGRLDPGRGRRRRWLVGLTMITAALFVLLAANAGALTDVAVSIVYAMFSGYIVLQYSDVRDAYPAAMTGRALSLFTMAMFLGVALMQWLTGAVASAATAFGLPPYTVVLGTIAALLAAGALAFVLLPQPGGRPAESLSSAK